MDPKESKSIKDAAARIEGALKAFEDILEDSNSELLYKSCGHLLQALRNIHGMDPALLSGEARTRIEEILVKEKAKPGRDSFNTGF